MQRRIIRTLITGAAVTALIVVGAGCATSPSASGASGTAGPTTYLAADGSCGGTPLPGIDLAAAQAVLKTYQTPPGQLFATTPLPKAPSPDTKVVVVDNGAAVGTLLAGFVKDAADAAGVQYTRVSAGTDAQSINTALNTVVEMKPDIVIAAGLDPSFYIDQLQSLKDSGTVFVTPAITNAADFSLTDSFIGHDSSVAWGDALAASAVAMTCGTTNDLVYYNVPELPPAALQLDAMKAALPKYCQNCTLRVVDIPITTLDTTAGDAIISDLQAHPETKFFFTSADQMQVGLPAKQKLAGIDVPGFGQSGLPANIQQVQEGSQLATVATDYEYDAWLFLDEGLRRAQGVEVNYADWTKLNPLTSTILTAQNVGPFVQGGGAIYPGFKDKLTALWDK